MTLTKTQRIYVGILALAIGAFGVDRLVLGGGPDEAQATAPHRPPALSAGPAPTGPTGQAGQVLGLLAALSGEGVDLSNLRNAFQPSAAWSAKLFPPAPAAPATSVSVAPAAATPAKSQALMQFAQDHHVMSIIRTNGGGSALIDGRLINVGNKLNGFTLIELTDTAAIFASDAGRVER